MYLVVDLWALLGRAEEDSLEGLPVPAAHEVVEDRVQGGGEEVEAARHVHQVLVERPIPANKTETNPCTVCTLGRST